MSREILFIGGHSAINIGALVVFNKQTSGAINEIMGTIMLAFEEMFEKLVPALEEIRKMFLDWVIPGNANKRWTTPKKIKPKKYMLNHKSRMFCCGNKGNYRRY